MKKIWSLIPGEYRKGCLKVAASVPVQALLDMVGVAALVPAMMLVLDSSKLESSFLGSLANMMNIDMGTDFRIFIIISVMVMLFLKMVISLFITDTQNRFLLSLYRNLSSRLFVSLYSRGLLYVKNNNSSRLSFNVINVCHSFVMDYLGGLMKLAGDSVFIILVLAAMFVWSAKATLMAVCALIPVITLYVIAVRKPLKETSRKENEERRDQSRLLYETFRGYSEVLVNDAFPSISRRFSDGLANISGYRVRIRRIQSIPLYLLELSVVIIVTVLVLFDISSGSSPDMLFIGVFSAALLRLIPAARSIVASISALNTSEYTKDIIADINAPSMFKALHEADVPAMDFKEEIRVKDLSFRFGDGDVPVLEHLDFRIPKGCRFGIKGRTGSGKTTLFNILLGLYPPSEGQVLIDGVPLSAENQASWHKIVGYVPQDVFVADATLLENVALGFEADDIDRGKAMDSLRQVSLGDFVERLPKGLDTRIGEAGCKLSGGQRQRLGIARALYKDVEVMFFDEATSSLDTKTEHEVNEAIRLLSETHRTITIIVISHRESSLSFCDELLQL